MESMTAGELLELGIIDDNTEIFICDTDFNVLARYVWYQDEMLDLSEREIESFTWRKDNEICIVLE